MKTIKVLLALCLTCCMLMSCKSKDSEPNQPVQINLKEKAEEVATYLTDNYNVGDSVFFITETGETEGFIVTQNYFLELIYTPEYDFGEPEPEPVLSGYKLSTEMKSKKDTFWIEMFIDEPQMGVVGVEGSIAINHKFDVEFNLITNMAGDSITIVYPSYDKSCTLRKNVGLTRVQNNSSTWDLIQ